VDRALAPPEPPASRPVVPIAITSREEAEPVPVSEPPAPAPRQIVRVRPARGAFTNLPTGVPGDRAPAAAGCGCGGATCGC
jgi:hypothetical protein